MTDEEKNRLKSVEEAVIKFSTIADIVLVDVKDRLKALENSNGATGKDIASGDSKTFWRCMGITGAMFLLFIGAVVYFNNMDGKIFTKLNEDKIEIIKEVQNVRIEMLQTLSTTQQNINENTKKASKLNYRGLKKIIEKE